MQTQLSIGGRGSGAALHRHSAAWNMLVYGRKKWYISAPTHNRALFGGTSSLGQRQHPLALLSSKVYKVCP
jgi:hypothetical protein